MRELVRASQDHHHPIDIEITSCVYAFFISRGWGSYKESSQYRTAIKHESNKDQIGAKDR